MFLRIQAKTLHLQPSIFSNATANITVSENNITLSTLFNTSLGPATIFNLDPSITTTVSLSYVDFADEPDAVLEMEEFVITVDNNTQSSSILPTQTLPPSISLPTFMPPSPTSTPSPSSTPSSPPKPSKHRMIAEAVGITIGLGLGLTALSAVVFYYWRRRRKRREMDTSSWVG